MPYLATRRNALSSDLGGAPSSSAASTASSMPAQAPTSPAYNDFRAYLGANGPQAQALLQRILSPIDQQAASAAAAPAGRPDTFESTGEYQDKNAQRAQASQSLTGTGEQSFLNTALGQATQAPTYSQQMRAFDENLLRASGADAAADALRGKYAGLLGALDLPSGPIEGRYNEGGGVRKIPIEGPKPQPAMPNPESDPRPYNTPGQYEPADNRTPDPRPKIKRPAWDR